VGVQSGAGSHNLLLAALSKADRDGIIEAGQVVSLRLKKVLREPGNPVEYLYFPFHGVISLLTVLDEDGAAVEIATVGYEGMADTAAYLGIDSQIRWLVQVPGDALRIEVDKLQSLAACSEGIRDVFNRYMVAMYILVSQTAACNRRHPVQERCARWLLMTHDRVENDDFPMTHDFLADMLGTRRASVSIAMKTLRNAGLIDYHHGRVTVIDRPGLEESACECHAFVRYHFDTHFPQFV
jgi:CRP-like cAMP-binding protein